LSSVSSATTCFNFRFSSGSCFSPFAPPLFIPPYFAFQPVVSLLADPVLST
jgi:hypothetical protein